MVDLADAGLSKKKVLSDLKGLKGVDEKKAYLNKLLKKKSLDKGLKDFVLLSLAELVFDEGDLWGAGDCYGGLSDKSGLLKVADTFLKNKAFANAFTFYRQAGFKDFSKISKALAQEGDFWGVACVAEESGDRKGLLFAAEKLYEGNRFEESSLVYEKLGFHESDKVKELEVIFDVYNKANLGVKAKEVDKRIRALKKK